MYSFLLSLKLFAKLSLDLDVFGEILWFIFKKLLIKVSLLFFVFFKTGLVIFNHSIKEFLVFSDESIFFSFIIKDDLSLVILLIRLVTR